MLLMWAFFVTMERCGFSSAMMALALLGLLMFESSLAFTIHDMSITRRPISLNMAGFGGGDSSTKKTAPSSPKLKAKAQWDRYLAMKQVESFPVGVKDKKSDDWLVVGKVRSQDVAEVSQATARQRALLADHAKRLFPLQISSQIQLEWGFEKDNTWTTVDPKEGDDLPNAFDKTIGFQGTADPNTGFYCVYNEGKLVEGGGTDRPSSKKLK